MSKSSKPSLVHYVSSSFKRRTKAKLVIVLNVIVLTPGMTVNVQDRGMPINDA